MSSTKNIHRLLFGALVVMAAVQCFWGLSFHPVERWDEGTNLQVVTETLQSSSPWILKLNDGPFWEKPPLWYDAGLVSVSFFGNSIFSLRLVTAVAGFLLVLLVYGMARAWYSPLSGSVAGLVMLSIGQLWQYNPANVFATHNLRSADSDALQMLLMTLTVFALTKALQSQRWLYLGALLTGLAFMTKGPLAFLPTLLFAVWVLGQRIKFTRKSVLTAFGLFGFMVLPWHLLMTIFYGGRFWNEYLGYHLLARLGGALEGHREGGGYYLGLLMKPEFFPGIGLFVAALAFGAWRWVKRRRFEEFVLLGMTLGTFVIISLAGTKLAWYLLPVYPFVAVLAGGMIAAVLDRGLGLASPKKVI